VQTTRQVFSGCHFCDICLLLYCDLYTNSGKAHLEENITPCFVKNNCTEELNDKYEKIKYIIFSLKVNLNFEKILKF